MQQPHTPALTVSGRWVTYKGYNQINWNEYINLTLAVRTLQSGEIFSKEKNLFWKSLFKNRLAYDLSVFLISSVTPLLTYPWVSINSLNKSVNLSCLSPSIDYVRCASQRCKRLDAPEARREDYLIPTIHQAINGKLWGAMWRETDCTTGIKP